MVEFIEQRGGCLFGFIEINGPVLIGIKQPHRAAGRGKAGQLPRNELIAREFRIAVRLVIMGGISFRKRR